MVVQHGHDPVRIERLAGVSRHETRAARRALISSRKACTFSGGVEPSTIAVIGTSSAVGGRSPARSRALSDRPITSHSRNQCTPGSDHTGPAFDPVPAKDVHRRQHAGRRFDAVGSSRKDEPHPGGIRRDQPQRLHRPQGLTASAASDGSAAGIGARDRGSRRGGSEFDAEVVTFGLCDRSGRRGGRRGGRRTRRGVPGSAGIGPSGSRVVMPWVWRWSATSLSQAICCVVERGVVVGVDGAQRGLQPRCVELWIAAARASPTSSSSRSPRRRSASGPQRCSARVAVTSAYSTTCGQCSRIQCLRASRPFAGGAEDLVDVDEGELPGADGVDDGAGVVGCGVEDRVEGWRRRSMRSVRLRTAGQDGSWRSAVTSQLRVAASRPLRSCHCSPLLGGLGDGTEAGPGDVVAGPPAGDVGDEAVPGGFADRVGGAWSDELVEPVGLGRRRAGRRGRRRAGGWPGRMCSTSPGYEPSAVTVGVPPGELRLDAVPEAVEGASAVGGQVADGDAAVEDDDVVPRQFAFAARWPSAETNPTWTVPARVVDGVDGADVVPVEGLDPQPDGGVAGGVLGGVRAVGRAVGRRSRACWVAIRAARRAMPSRSSRSASGRVRARLVDDGRRRGRGCGRGAWPATSTSARRGPRRRRRVRRGRCRCRGGRGRGRLRRRGGRGRGR